MSSARFEVTWRNKNIQFISGPLKLIEIQRAVMSFIMLVELHGAQSDVGNRDV